MQQLLKYEMALLDSSARVVVLRVTTCYATKVQRSSDLPKVLAIQIGSI